MKEVVPNYVEAIKNSVFSMEYTHIYKLLKEKGALEIELNGKPVKLVLGEDVFLCLADKKQ